MFEELNDDIRLHIISYLNLKEQLLIWEATENRQTKINNNIIYNWQRKKSYYIDAEMIDWLNEKPKYLDIFLSSISPTIEKLQLKFISLRKMDGWKYHNFPNLRALNYSLDDYDEAVAAQKLFVELFPGLTSVSPYGFFDGAIISKWQQLRKLDLTDCWLIEDCPSVSGIQMLEDLTMVCPRRHNDFLISLLALPNFQTLYLQPIARCNIILQQIIELRCLDIEDIIFHDLIWDCQLEQLLTLKNLRKLTLIEDDGFKVDQMQSLVAGLPLLEQLHLVDLQFWRVETELWATVDMCPTLKVLNISGMQLYTDFFASSRRFMEDVLTRRTSPLKLHCHNTGSNESLIRRNFQHAKLKVSFEPLPVDNIEPTCVKIKFVPLIKSNPV